MSKKLFSIVLCAAIVTSIFTGCSSNSKPTNTGNSGNGKETSNEVSFVFTKGGFDGGPENDIIKQEIEKKANIKLNHIAPPAANYIEKVNIILSSKELPDLVKLQGNMFNDLFNYAEQGALMDLTELVKKAPNILKNIPKEALDRCTIDGKLYAIPAWCSPNRMNTIIRQDWLDNLSLKAPTTLDDYHNVLAAFTKNDPDKNGKNDTYGITGAGLETFEPVFGAFGVTGVTNFWYEENGQLKSQATNPKVVEALKILKNWYAEGLIDPEFVVIKNDSEINEKAMKNQFGMTYRWWTYEPKIEAEMKKVDPKVSFARIAPPVGPTGESGVRGVNLINGCVIMLKDAKNPEAAMRLLDYMHTENGMMTQYSGVEGVHWEKKADGKYYTLPQFTKDQKWIQWYAAFENEWPLLQVETPLVQSRRDSFNWKVIKNAGDGLLTDAERKYSADLSTLISAEYSKFITGKRDIGEFDKFVQEWKTAGGSQWTKEINERFKAKK
jgi:putative aldouronate transport system substrate-binding protein